MRASRERPGGEALRVLMVNTVSMATGGIATVMRNYAAHLPRDGLRLDIAAFLDVDAFLDGGAGGLDAGVYRLPDRNRHPVRYVAALARLVRKNGYDVVHANGNSATMAVEMLGALLGGARVRIVHRHSSSCKYGRLDRLLSPFMLAWANVRLACSREAGEAMFGGRPFEIVRNASDLSRFRYDPETRRRVRREMGAADGGTLVGAVAMFDPVKNHAFLLEAFAAALRENPGMKLALIGDGPLRPEIEAAIARLGIGGSVVLTGRVRDVPERMQALDALALPSSYEGFPNAVVEAQASGLPALVSDAVTRDCDMTGRVTFLPLESDAWAGAMARAARAEGPDREAACALGAERLRAGGYDIRTEARRLGALYADAAKKYIPERETR